MTVADRPPGDLLFWRLATLLSGTGFATLALFVALPEIDIWAAGLFYDGGGFPLRESPALGALRLVYKTAFVGVCALVAATLAVRLIDPAGWRTPVRPWAYLCAVLAVGPGLIANALLKEHWGRARPEAVASFGGDRPFTAPFALSDACASNCSFVSGEGAAAAALAFGLLAAFWPTLRTARARAVAVGGVTLWLLGAALIRMGPGKHFLSDTLFAFILMGLTAAALYRVFALGAVRADATPEAACRDAMRAMARIAAAARFDRRPAAPPDQDADGDGRAIDPA